VPITASSSHSANIRATGVGAGERRHHAILAVDRVRRRQQLPRGLAPQDVAAGARGDPVGRVRLPALELLDAELARERPDVPSDVRREPRDVEGVDRRDELRAGIHQAAASLRRR
jgi:hypothetical protein